MKTKLISLLLLLFGLVFILQSLWKEDVGETQQINANTQHFAEAIPNSKDKADTNRLLPTPDQPSPAFNTQPVGEKQKAQGDTSHLKGHIEKLNSTEEEIVLAGEEAMRRYYQPDTSPLEKYQALAAFNELLENYELDAKSGLVDKAFGSEGELYYQTSFLLHARMHLLSDTMGDSKTAREHLQQALDYYNLNADETDMPDLTASELKTMIVELDSRMPINKR